MRYRKKPVVIEAIQFDGTYDSMYQIRIKFPDLKTHSAEYNEAINKVNH